MFVRVRTRSTKSTRHGSGRGARADGDLIFPGCEYSPPELSRAGGAPDLYEVRQLEDYQVIFWVQMPQGSGKGARRWNVLNVKFIPA
jgi:hypothetical protein